MALFNFGNNNPQANLQRFPRSYTLTDFGMTADVVCQPYDYRTIGTVTVPAQQQVTFGNTEMINGGAQGAICYLKLVDTSVATCVGLVRFSLANANLTNEIVVKEERTEKLLASQYDRTLGVVMPEYSIKAKQDSKLLIKFKPDGASAITIDYDATNTVGIIPVTVYQ